MTAVVPAGEVAYGIQLPVQAQSTYFVEPWERTAGPDEMLAVAQAADRSGFFYVAVCDHVAIPRELAEAMGTTWYDTVATLSWLAAQTARVRLLSSVFNLGYRHPLASAKSFATLDRLSGGRVIAGVGAGHVQAEFAALGIDFHRRGALLDEAIDTFRAALSEEYVGGLGVSPRPVQESMPIWVGGSAAAAVRRAATRGDGWLPQGTPLAKLPPLIAQFHAHRDGAPADLGAITEWLYVGTPGWDVDRPCSSGSPEQVADALRRWVELGVNHLQVRFPSRSRSELVDQVEAFGSTVGPLLKG